MKLYKYWGLRSEEWKRVKKFLHKNKDASKTVSGQEHQIFSTTAAMFLTWIGADIDQAKNSTIAFKVSSW